MRDRRRRQAGCPRPAPDRCRPGDRRSLRARCSCLHMDVGTARVSWATQSGSADHVADVVGRSACKHHQSYGEPRDQGWLTQGQMVLLMPRTPEHLLLAPSCSRPMPCSSLTSTSQAGVQAPSVRTRGNEGCPGQHRVCDAGHGEKSVTGSRNTRLKGGLGNQPHPRVSALL